MAKGPRYTGRPAPPPKPTTALAAAPHVRAFMLKLFDRQDGMPADWPLIAETLLKEAFAAVDLAAADPKTADLAQKIVCRVHAGAYDRLTATPGDPFKEAPPAPRTAPSVDYAGPQRHAADNPQPHTQQKQDDARFR